MLNRSISVIALSVIALLTDPRVAAAVPGSGSAIITPSSDVIVGSTGTWTVEYTCEDPFNNGLLRITIPAGWTAPQNGSPTSPGYITVTGDDPLSNPLVNISGQVISITIDNLGNLKHIWVAYGDTQSGSNPGAVAQAPTVPQDSMVFLVESDPTGASPVPIASSPSLNVVAGPISQLVFTSSPFSFSVTGEAGPMVVEAQDQYGNPQSVSSDQQIDLSSTSTGGSFSLLGGGNFSPVSSVVMSAGTDTVSFYYRDTVSGSPTVSASGSGQTWTPATQQQTVSPGEPFALRIEPADTTITAGDFMRFRVYSIDEYGNRSAVDSSRTFLLSSAPSGSFYLPADHSTPVPSVTMQAGNDSLVVDYRNTDANAGDPHLVIVLSNDGLSPSLVGTAGVTVVPAGISTTVSDLSAETPVVADGTSISTVTVTVRDGYGNPISGVGVVLGVGGSAVKSDPAGPTGSDGVATGTVTDTRAEAVWVRAYAGGQLLADSSLVEFVAGPVDGAVSEVAATSPVVADGVDGSVITVRAKDSQGNAVSGADVVLSVEPVVSGDVLTQPGGVTDSYGEATGTLRGVAAGTRVVRAVINGVSVDDSAVVELVPGSAASFVWSHDGAAVAGVAEDVTLEVLDGEGNRVVDYADSVYLYTSSGGTGDGVVEWFLGGGAGGTLVNLVGDSAVYVFDAGDGGMVNLRVRDERMEGIVLSAVRGAASGTSSTLSVDHGTADRLVLVSGDGQVAEVGTAVGSSLVVRVEDQFGNAVDGEAVTFTVVTGGGSVDVVSGGGVDSVAVSGVDGSAVCEEWVLGVVSGANVVRAHMAAGSVSSVDFGASGTAGTGVDIVLAPGSKSVTVGSETVVRAALKDAYGNAVAGKQVDILISGTASGTLIANDGDPNPTQAVSASWRYGTTDSLGEISVKYVAPQTAGVVDSVDAFGDGASRGVVDDVVYTSVASGATDLRIVWVGSDSARAGETFVFRVEAVDGNGNVDGSNGSVVDLGAGGGGIEFSESDFGAVVTRVTLVSGEKLVYGRGRYAGSWTITVSDTAGVLGGGSGVVVLEDAGVVDHYWVSTVDSVVAGVSFNVEVEARDVWENRVLGASNSVSLVAVDGADSLVVEVDTLLVGSAGLVDGRVVVGESYVRAGEIRVRVRDGGNKEGYSGVVKVKPAGAYQVVKVSGDSTGVVAGNDVGLTVRVLDLYGNGVSGETVVFSVLSGGGSVSPGSVASGAGGSAGAVLTTGVVAGENRVKASILDGTPENIETVEFVVGTVASGISYYTVVPAKTTVEAGEWMGVEVRAYDGNDNLVVEDSSTVVELGSSTGNAEYASPVGVLVGGVYTTTVRDTVAESVVLTVSTQGGGASGSSVPVSVTHAVAYEVVKVSGDTSGVEVRSRRRLEVEVRDRYGNVVDGQVVIYSVVGDPGGDAYLRDAVGDTTDGITSTGVDGRAWVEVVTSTQAGTNEVRASILDGTPASLETKSFTVTTTAGAIAYYRVLPDVTQQTAGVPVNLVIEAYDSDDNLVPDDTTAVVLSMERGGGTFGANPVILQGGTVSTTVTATAADTIQVRATSQGGTATGLSPPILIVPDLPSGIIQAAATRDTITANGSARDTIYAGPVRDQYGNVVSSGTKIRISITDGSIITPDQDPSTPTTNEQLTDSQGNFTFQIQSGTVPGTASISLSSVTGSASGGLDIYYAEVPAFASTSPPVPSLVVPGDSVSFEVVVTNTSQTDVTLTSATTFDFSDGVDAFSAPLVSSLYLGSLSQDTLVFEKELVSTALDPGAYQPQVTLRGVDQYGEPFSVACPLPSNSLVLSTIEIVSISAPGTVSKGQTFIATVGVSNKGTIEVIVTDVSITIPLGTYTVSTPPSLPDTVGFGQTIYIDVPVTISSSSAAVTTTIDASVLGTASGLSVSDNTIDPYPKPQLVIQSAASFSYVAGSLDPVTVSQGQSHAFSLGVANSGSATVTLDPAKSRIFVTDGVDTFSADLEQSTAVAGNSSQTLTFLEQIVPPVLDAGSYNVSVHLEGDENGRLFTADFQTSDLLRVDTPVALSYRAGSLAPERVSKTTSVSFQVGVDNTGSATLVLDPDSTRFEFAGGLYDAALDEKFASTIDPGSNTLTFVSEIIDPSLPSQAYLPSVRIVGSENGVPFAATIPLGDTVRVEDAPELAILSISSTQPSMTADQTPAIGLWMKVQNSGQADVRLDSTRVRFILGGNDLTGDFIIVPPTGFTSGTTLAGGSVDSLLFVVTDNTSNSMHTGPFTIEGLLWMTDLNNMQPIQADTDQGGKGSLLVQSPANLVITALAPSQDKVTADQTRPFQVRMVVSNTGESDASVSFALTDTYLQFDRGTTWSWTIQPTLASGDSILYGGGVDTVLFTVAKAGEAAGPTRIDGTISAIELNSNRSVADNTLTSGWGEVLVQTPAVLDVLSVTPSQPSVTAGSALDWTVSVLVQNGGESDLDLVLPDSMRIAIQDAQGTYLMVEPSEFASGGTLLTGGQSDELIVTVDSTGTVSASGLKTISIDLYGVESNSGRGVAGSGTGAVTIQYPPDLAYVSGTLSPDTVSSGAVVGFVLDVANLVSGGSTVMLDRAGTRLRFGSGRFEAGLDISSGVSVAGGGTTELRFVATEVDTGIPIGAQNDVELVLVGEENGNGYGEVEALPAGELVVEAAPVLSIKSVTASQATVTRSQGREWTVAMEVENRGDAAVDLDLSSAVTHIGFEAVGVGDVSAEYVVEQPLGLEGVGGNRLAGKSSGVLVFRVTQTGVTEGLVLISGRVEGVDVNSGERVWDDTFSGGSGSVLVQAPGVLEVVGITNRPTVTAGQGTDWSAVVHVRNSGEAALDLVFDSAYPKIASSPDTGIVWIEPASLMGGGTVIQGGREDSLAFTADSTGADLRGRLRLDASVLGVELNSGDMRSFDTAAADTGYGGVLVQAPPRLVVNSVAIVSPNSPRVNTGQQFSVAVTVENTGEAAASDIVVKLSALGGSEVQDSTVIVPSLSGSTVVVDTFSVRAPSTPGVDTLIASIAEALDGNSGESTLVAVGPHIEDRKELVVEYPASLVIEKLEPSRSSVTRQQTKPWSVKAVIRNAGGAPVDLEPPTADDLAFYLDARELLDYVVDPPDTFLTGRAGWVLPGGESDSLEYTITTTGSDTGSVRIELTLDAVDVNDLGARSAVEDTTVVVQSQAGLLVAETRAVAPNMPAPNLAIVNVGQQFTIDVLVANSGESVDSVRVELGSDGGSQIGSTPSGFVSIDKDSSHTFRFDVTAGSSPVQQEIFTARITYAISANSGQEVIPQPPLDNTEVIRIETPADLVLGASVFEPAGALDDTVSTGQIFGLAAAVANLGTAAVDSSGIVSITLPQGFRLAAPSPPADTSFVVGDSIRWWVAAPDSSGSDRKIVLAITTVPVDRNTAASALVSKGSDTLSIEVVEKAAFISSSVAVESPAGARDGVLSTGQRFTVRSRLAANGSSTSLRAVLGIPPASGFALASGDTAVDLGEGTGAEKTADFELLAPSAPAGDSLVIRYFLVDENSGDPSQRADTLALTVVPKAMLALDAWIDSPEEAKDSTVTPFLPFTLKAVVRNLGTAGVDTSTAKPRIVLSNTGSYTVQSPKRQAFSTVDTVAWRITAPASSGIVQFKIGIESLPLDENSMQPAALSGPGERFIPIQMEAARVEIVNVTEAVGFETRTKPVPQGRSDLGLLAVAITNPSSNENAVELRSLDLWVLDGKERDVADPGRVLSGLRARLSSGGTVNAVISSTNPVRVDFGASVRLDSGETDTVSIYVDVSASAPEGKFYVAIEDTSDVTVVDVLSGSGMVVVDGETEQGDIAGRYRSRGLVIGSRNFKDYVRNYPNPFGAGREETRITYFLDGPATVTIKIYSLAGKLVYEKRYDSGSPEGSPGEHEITWDGRNMRGEVVRNGIYICRIQAGPNSASIKIAVAK